MLKLQSQSARFIDCDIKFLDMRFKVIVESKVNFGNFYTFALLAFSTFAVTLVVCEKFGPQLLTDTGETWLALEMSWHALG